jgi:haloacetate dehalogenase
VAHRLALDHPDSVTRLMLLDVSPTLTMYEQTSMEFARSYWWWFWLIQPAPFPETMVAAAPEVFLRKKIGWGHAGLTPFTDETYAAYLSHVSDPATMHAMCEDYRAAASIDLDHDRADRDAGRLVSCPIHALWGEFGTVHRCFQPLDDWRGVARDAPVRALHPRRGARRAHRGDRAILRGVGETRSRRLPTASVSGEAWHRWVMYERSTALIRD